MLTPRRRQWLYRWVLKGTRARGEPVRLRYRRIYIVPTMNGLMFALLLLVMWLSSINYNNSMGFALTFLLASLSVVAILHTFRNLVGLSLRALPATPVFAGEKAAFPLRADDPGRRHRHAIGLQYGKQLQSLTDIAPASPGQLTLQLPTQRRGWLQAERCAVFTIFPLGLFRAWSWLDLNLRCLVYPAPEPGTIPPPQGFHDARQSGCSASGDEDLDGLRKYRPGDSLRQVSWKTLARGQELHTKQFAGGGPDWLWLDWEAAAGLDTEARLSRLCRWVIDAEASGRRYGLKLPGARIEPSQGREHYHRCLSTLAQYPA